MAVVVEDKARFFIAGGTLPVEAESYVGRAADTALLQALLEGKFAYVLNSRQMGKSSLCVRTMARLQTAGVRTAFVDLTRIGGRNVTPEQWYAGISAEIGRSLGLRSEFLNYWKHHPEVGAMQRLFGAIREVALSDQGTKHNTEGIRLAVFFDEIDACRSLSFSADEFFAGIRECFNRRVQDPVYNQLTFCLLGVAVPSDLIQNPTSTPFNVGERIYLKDFTLEEALAFAEGVNLGGNGRALVERVFYWTDGHPFLTQSLCSAIANEPRIKTPSDVDALVRRDLFDPIARETNINLADVANRALHAGDLEPDPEKFRADLLSTYKKAWKGKPILDDESNRVAVLLKLSGIMRSDGKSLSVRNGIYRQVFGAQWIAENMPGQELRRQRRSFWLGVARTSAISVAVIAVIGYLAWNNARLARIADLQRDQAEYASYLASMRSLPATYSQNNLFAIEQTLESLKSNPARGWEWDLWHRRVTRGAERIEVPGEGATCVQASPDKTKIAFNRWSRIWIYDLSSAKLVGRYELSSSFPTVSQIAWCGNRYLVAFNLKSDLAVLDTNSGHVDYHRSLGARPTWQGVASPASGGVMFGWGDRSEPLLIQIPSCKVCLLSHAFSPGWVTGSISPDASMAAWEATNRKFDADMIVVYDLKANKELRRIDCPKVFGHPVWLPNGKDILFSGTYDQLATFVCYEAASGKTLWQSHMAIGNMAFVPSFSKDGDLMSAATLQGMAYVFALSSKGMRLRQTIKESSFSDFDASGDPISFYRDIEIYKRPREPAEETWSYKDLSAFDISGAGVVRTFDAVRRIQIDTRVAPLRAAPIPGFQHSDYLDLTGAGFVEVNPDGLSLRNEDGSSRYHVIVPPQVLGGRGPQQVIMRWSISRDRNQIAVDQTSTPIAQIALYRRPSPSPVKMLGCLGAVQTYSFSPDGTLFGACDDAGYLEVWRTSDWARVLSLQVGSNYAQKLDFSPDSKQVALADLDGFGYIVDIARGRVRAVLRGHTQKLNCICWSSDGRRIVTGSADRTVRIWDPATGEEIGIIAQLRSGPDSMRFTDNGRNLVIVSDDGDELVVLRTSGGDG